MLRCAVGGVGRIQDASSDVLHHKSIDGGAVSGTVHRLERRRTVDCGEGQGLGAGAGMINTGVLEGGQG